MSARRDGKISMRAAHNGIEDHPARNLVKATVHGLVSSSAGQVSNAQLLLNRGISHEHGSVLKGSESSAREKDWLEIGRADGWGRDRRGAEQPVSFESAR